MADETTKLHKVIYKYKTFLFHNNMTVNVIKKIFKNRDLKESDR